MNHTPPTDDETRSVREEQLLNEIDHLRGGLTALIQPYLTRSGNSDVGDLARSIRRLLEQTRLTATGSGLQRPT
ncbi:MULTISPECIES: hypothetical protein [Mycobacterium avium complex (MAC)]|uniref:hypothetical protein n=1 Tax=Mycobacterium avium complex (MAC) TaxID=120793 RepID=UPI0009FE108F|nr:MULTISPECIES: hypothetical protein [Mycobacterium avium complex (MAC)]UCN12647.1 hypothetical protein LFT50_29595 [Mycobacterium intracellulare subsp. chimaera]